MLRILTPPPSMMSGSDRFSARTVADLREHGISCEHLNLWPESIAHAMNRMLPFRIRRRLYKCLVAQVSVAGLLRRVMPGDVVWILDAALPDDAACRFERAVVRRGAHYVFHLQDNWFDLRPDTDRMARERIPLASLVTVPSQALANRVQREFPDAQVSFFEEPVDVDRLSPHDDGARREGRKTVVWAGNIKNLVEISRLKEVLEAVNRDDPFLLRVITGQRSGRSLPLDCPWELHPYDCRREPMLLQDALAGLAPMEESPYSQCKGTYKVKVYMAAGIPPIASPVGRQRELIREGETGFLPATDDDWKTALRRVLRDPQLARRVGDAARREARARFSHAAVMPVWAAELKRRFPEIEAGSPVSGDRR